jgi:penicillin-binding protein 2
MWGDLIGKEGIEKGYESVLRGERGVKYVETNAIGRELRGFPERSIDPQLGGNVVLTIDRHLQQVAEGAFPDSMAGSLVAIDPRNGEILAMVSKPSFDPSIFSGVLSPDQWDELNSDPMHRLLNRSIQSAYPPASTLKMLSAIVGLDTGLIDRDTRFGPCSGSLFFGDRKFGCWGVHGRVDVTDAIIQSCDVFFYLLAQRMDMDIWNTYAQQLGFGLPTGIDLGNEAQGLLPSRAYYDQRYGKYGWSKGAMLNLSIGQGEILATPIQMARYIGAIGTGKLCTPHLVRRVEGRRRVPQALVCQDIAIPPQVLQVVRNALVGVLEDEKGTAHLSRIPGLRFAGKTGTAQNPHGEDHAWFVAFAPAEYPTIAISAIVENGGHGSSVAAPMVKKVIEAYLQVGIAYSERAKLGRG